MTLTAVYLSLMAIVLIPFVPFIMYNYKEVKSTKKQALIYGILSMMINFLICKCIGFRLMYIVIFTFVPAMCGTIFNYLIVSDGINIKKIPKSFGVFLLFMFSSVFQLIAAAFLNYDIDNLKDNQQLILSLISDLILLFILIYIYRRTIIDDFRKLIKDVNRIFDISIKYWLIGLLCMMASNFLINILTPARAVNEEAVQEVIHSSKYLAIFTMGIVGPMIEELVFRKSFRDVFKNDKAFIIASGLVFGSLHVLLSLSSSFDLLYIIPYSSLGIVFAAMYAKTDNIYSSMSMHMFHNTVLTIISLL